MTIINYASSSIDKLKASLNDYARVVIYDRHMFIVQATGQHEVLRISTLPGWGIVILPNSTGPFFQLVSRCHQPQGGGVHSEAGEGGQLPRQERRLCKTRICSLAQVSLFDIKPELANVVY